MINPEIQLLSKNLGSSLHEKGLKITTAESCTGGGVSSAITEVAGSSAWFHRGFVTYSNEAKSELLDIPMNLILKHGAVSEPVALAMLDGALRKDAADLGVAVSGIAGPGGAVEGKPVGTVCFAWGSGDRRKSDTFHFSGNRAEVREQSVRQALELCCNWLNNKSTV